MKEQMLQNGDRDTSTEIEDPDLALTAALQLELVTLPPLSKDCSIFRVPERLRQLNPKAYTPRVVSIGPLHHGKGNLVRMEDFKKRYLQNYLRRTRLKMEDCIRHIRKNEERLRSCYVEKIEYSSDEFLKLVLVDAAFMVELFLKWYFGGGIGRCDRITSTPRMKFDVRFDLFLLENQLPFFILQDLLALGNVDRFSKVSLLELVIHFINTNCFFSANDDISIEDSDFSSVSHLVALLRIVLKPSSWPNESERPYLSFPRATELHRASIKFQRRDSKDLFNVNFQGKVLEVPQLCILDSTELIFRNLLAFEQCHCEDDLYIADYIGFMNALVNSGEDADMLIQHEIIDNWLQGSEDVATFFKKLDQEAVYSSNYYFAAIATKLNKHCRAPWNKWVATLKQNYFNTPWAFISVVGAVILLILTLIQAVCSIISVV